MWKEYMRLCVKEREGWIEKESDKEIQTMRIERDAWQKKVLERVSGSPGVSGCL